MKQGLDRSAVVFLKITGVERELDGFPVGGTPALRPKKKLDSNGCNLIWAIPSAKVV
jgi:hypothetical protein